MEKITLDPRKLQELRAKKDKTQTQAARLAKVSWQTLQRAENGIAVSIAMATKIAEFYGKKLGALETRERKSA